MQVHEDTLPSTLGLPPWRVSAVDNLLACLVPCVPVERAAYCERACRAEDHLTWNSLYKVCPWGTLQPMHPPLDSELIHVCDLSDVGRKIRPLCHLVEFPDSCLVP